MIDNHIGKKTWKKLSYRQKQAIIKDRQNARKMATVFIKEKSS